MAASVGPSYGAGEGTLLATDPAARNRHHKQKHRQQAESATAVNVQAEEETLRRKEATTDSS
jgi:hypothetical protein